MQVSAISYHARKCKQRDVNKRILFICISGRNRKAGRCAH